jgi:hypothetical protein
VRSSSSSISSWRSSSSSSCSVLRCRWSVIFALELLRDIFTFFDSLSNCLNSASVIRRDPQRHTLISADINEMSKELRLSQQKSKSLELAQWSFSYLGRISKLQSAHEDEAIPLPCRVYYVYRDNLSFARNSPRPVSEDLSPAQSSTRQHPPQHTRKHTCTEPSCALVNVN